MNKAIFRKRGSDAVVRSAPDSIRAASIETGLQLQRVRVWHDDHLAEIASLHVPELLEAPAFGLTEDSQHEYWLLPGLIDLSSAFREPGFEHQGTIDSESRAALAGGFTTVCCPPSTDPVNDSPAVTRLILEQAGLAGLIKVLPIAAMTAGLGGDVLADMCALKQAGCVAVTNLRAPVKNSLVLRRCFEYARSHDICVLAVPEDAALGAYGVASESDLSSKIGLPGVPEVAETLAVSSLLILAEDTGVRLHLSQISCGRSVEMIAAAKQRGLAVTADVALANLLLNDRCVASFNPVFRVQPPLRSEADRLALLKGLEDGVIDAITTHHEPVDEASKLAPFAEAQPGMSLLEVAVPLLMGLSAAGELRPETWIAALSSGPRRVLGDASTNAAVPPDLVLVDTDAEWRPQAGELYSKGKNCPWLGQALSGRVIATIVDGRILYQLDGV
ncbi:dihydroorotase [Allohahella marinimesophila]|uniref:Dihydroorotase n=1 Tax=Allohahella marinimesophila TaxID=1054972 RepID=A0ABP7PGJ3_9GAMM